MTKCFGGYHHSWQLVFKFTISYFIEIVYKIASAMHFVMHAMRHFAIFLQKMIKVAESFKLL